MEAMNATQTPVPKTDLAVTHVLAQLLEKLDHSAVPVGAEQYRSVVMHLVEEFRDVEQGAELARLLDAYPAASEVYENMNYQHAGLCRSALDSSLSAEMAAKKAIERAMRPAKPDTANEQG
jgi:2-methylisocitrate lyase-like PEP mutase family enzyme